MLWGLGAKLPIPDSESEDGYRTMDERIMSFSWAKEIAPGRALLAYMNDSGQIIVMSVQYHLRRDASKRGSEKEWIWTLTQHVRIDGRGPHKEVKLMLSLSSFWLHVALHTHSFLGFRSTGPRFHPSR